MKLLDSLTPELTAFAKRQPVFFTSSAPLHGPHINLSPKGLASSHFSILSPTSAAYIDRTGSGCETISHAYENGRLVLMFMSFGDTPRILRLFCTARVIEYDSPQFQSYIGRIAGHTPDGARAVIVAQIWQVQTSCGYGVPRVKKALYTEGEEAAEVAKLAQGDKELAVFEERPALDAWAKTKVESNTLREYQRGNNARSLDGLPGLKAARKDAGEVLWLGDVRARMARVGKETEALALGFALATLFWALLRVFV